MLEEQLNDLAIFQIDVSDMEMDSSFFSQSRLTKARILAWMNLVILLRRGFRLGSRDTCQDFLSLFFWLMRLVKTGGRGWWFGRGFVLGMCLFALSRTVLENDKMSVSMSFEEDMQGFAVGKASFNSDLNAGQFAYGSSIGAGEGLARGWVLGKR